MTKEVQDPGDADREDDVASAVRSNFRLENGTLTLSTLGFHIFEPSWLLRENQEV
jgi:hypothetical protein